MSVMVDDREDVWANANDINEMFRGREGEPPRNLMLIRPYHFRGFEGFADVNNRSGKDLTSGANNGGGGGGGKGEDEKVFKEDDRGLLWTMDVLERLWKR